jgi:hypothetical protein
MLHDQQTRNDPQHAQRACRGRLSHDYLSLKVIAADWYRAAASGESIQRGKSAGVSRRNIAGNTVAISRRARIRAAVGPP